MSIIPIMSAARLPLQGCW